MNTLQSKPTQPNPELLSLHNALDQDASDQTIRSILADWYEDHNQPSVAMTLRWMVRNNHFPDKGFRGSYSHRDWVWFSDSDKSLSHRFQWYYEEGCRVAILQAVLPHKIFMLLEEKKFNNIGNAWTSYSSRIMAEEALVLVYLKNPNLFA